MKFLIGLILGAALTAAGAYWLMDRIGMDALLQVRLTSVNILVAIRSGIVDGKEQQVLQFTRDILQMELDEIESGADDAFFPETKKQVASMLERKREIEAALSASPSPGKQTP